MLIAKEHFSMIEHIRKLKMNQHEPHTQGIIHTITHEKITNYNIDNFTITPEYFELYLPYNWEGGYYRVQKDKENFYKNLWSIKFHIITLQVVLLMLFALISYFLSLRALRPMREAIHKLDNFSKDLIHDLNTPITAMLLNMKILKKKCDSQQNRVLGRIEHSLEDIGSLHANLSVLLEEETMLIKREEISGLIKEIAKTQEKIFAPLTIEVQINEFYAQVNADALKQIMINIISNACKYNRQNADINIYAKNRSIFIQDRGLGIQNPDKIFERAYTEHTSGHGIGLDIVKRLCSVMDIKISVDSKVGEGTTIQLAFE